jgi:hypothetical protein
MNTHLLIITFRVWCIEIAVSGVNYFVLMKGYTRRGSVSCERIESA